MSRSRKHLLGLAAASGLISGAVLVTDASRVWLAAGPALLAVLDAGLARPVRRLAAHVAGRWAYLVRDVNIDMRTRYLRAWAVRPTVATVLVGVAATVGSGINVAGSYLPGWASVALLAVVAAVVVRLLWHGIGLVVMAKILPEQVLQALEHFALASERQEDVPHRRQSGLPDKPLFHADAVSLIEKQLDRAAREKRLFVVLAVAATGLDAAGLDALVAAARRGALAARAASPPEAFCEVAHAGEGRRIVLADADTRRLFLAVLAAEDDAAALKVGVAKYRKDGTTAPALLAAAFKALASLSQP